MSVNVQCNIWKTFLELDESNYLHISPDDEVPHRSQSGRSQGPPDYGARVLQCLSFIRTTRKKTLVVNKDEVKAKKESLVAELTEDLLDDSIPDHKVRIGSILRPIQQKRLMELLAWHKDMNS